MKNIWTLILIVFISSCQTEEEAPKQPEDLNGLRTMLKEKKIALKELEVEIAEIEDKVLAMDPSIREVSKLVTSMEPNKGDFKHYVTIQGSVQSDDMVNVSSEVGGRIIKLTTDEGRYVQKGDLIAEIDLEGITKQMAELQKSQELAKELFDRQSRLWDQKIGSEIQYLQAKNNLERLETSMETLEFQMTKSKVFAPISGAVEMVLIHEGEMASPGAPIIQILNTSKLKVVADAPENLLGAIALRDRVSVVLPALSDTIDSKVTLLGRRIDPSNRTFEVEVGLPSSRGLKPNLLAEILVNDYTEEDVFIVPLELIQQEVGGKDFVMVSRSDGKEHRAKKVYIETGNSYNAEIVITSGLTDEHVLIMDGARGLADNELIEIANEQTSK